MDSIILYTHLITSFVIIVLLVLSISTAIFGHIKNKKYTKGKSKIYLITRIIISFQALLGIILYFKNGFAEMLGKLGQLSSMEQFFAVRHVLMMIIAIALISIGYIKANRKSEDRIKYKVISIFYSLGLIIILAAIPWSLI